MDKELAEKRFMYWVQTKGEYILDQSNISILRRALFNPDDCSEIAVPNKVRELEHYTFETCDVCKKRIGIGNNCDCD